MKIAFRRMNADGTNFTFDAFRIVHHETQIYNSDFDNIIFFLLDLKNHTSIHRYATYIYFAYK